MGFRRHIVLYLVLIIAFLAEGLAWAEDVVTDKAKIEDIKEEHAAPLEQSLAGNYLANRYSMNHQNPEQAAEIFLDALQDNPESVDLLSSGYKTLIEAGRVEEAVKVAEKYQSKNPSDLNVRLFLIIYSMSKGDFNNAEKILQDITSNNSEITVSAVNAVIVPFVKLWIKVGQKKYDEAIDYSKNVLGEGRSPSLFLNYQSGIIMDIMGDTKSAVKEFDEFTIDPRIVLPYHFVKVAGNFYERNSNKHKAEKLYLTYKKQHPDTKHFQHALVHLNSWIKNNGKIVPNAQFGFAEVLKEVVRVIYTGGYYREGLQYLRLALYINKNDDEAKMLLAKYYEETDEFLKAVKVYREIQRGSDFYLAAKVNAAEDMYKLGDKAKAVKLLKRVARKDNAPAPILLSLADLMRQDKKFKDAASVYTRVIAGINNPKIEDWAIFFARGICYERYGDWKKAESDLLHALNLRPDQPEVLNYLGYSWIDKGENIDEAKGMVEKAVKARPDDPQIIDSMGWVLFKLNEYDQATHFLEKAVSISPYDSVINDHLGDSYWKENRFNEAVFQWNRAIQYVSEDDDISIKKVKEKIKNGL